MPFGFRSVTGLSRNDSTAADDTRFELDPAPPEISRDLPILAMPSIGKIRVSSTINESRQPHGSLIEIGVRGFTVRCSPPQPQRNAASRTLASGSG